MQSTELVIFDCDGVLVDSETISVSVLIAGLAECGIAVDPDYVHEHFLGRSFPTVAAAIRDSWGVTLPSAFEDNYRSRLLERFETELRTTPGVEDMLGRLRCRSCVATSSSPARVHRTLALTGLARWFGQRVFTASEVAHGKPAPDLFLYAARRMGTAPGRVLVIEDSLPGVTAALSAGMQVMVYAGGSHMNGHGTAPGGPPVFDSWRDFPVELLTNTAGEAGS